MEDYAVRIKQLNDYRLYQLIKYFFFLILSIAIQVGLYHVFKLVYSVVIGDYLIFLNTMGICIFLYFLLTLIIIFVIFLFYFFNIDFDFKNYYLEILFLEAKLDEIYLLENKITFNHEKNEYLQTLFNFNDIKYISSFSDASNKYSIDVTTIQYRKNGDIHTGTLFNLNFMSEKKGFLQLKIDNNLPFHKYDGKQVKLYGFNLKSPLRNYHMFSTYDDKSYLIENKIFVKSFIEFERFINKRLNLVIDNESIYIFIEDYKFYFVDGVTSNINNSIFDEKMKAINKFHLMTFNMIETIDELFEPTL